MSTYLRKKIEKNAPDKSFSLSARSIPLVYSSIFLLK